MMKRYALKSCILLSVAYAMFRMAHWALGFTYFTQLSNLYVAAAVICQLAKPGRGSLLLKYTAAVSIVITFLVYLLVLAPMVPGGLIAAYRQDHWASLCLHVLTPAFAVADFLLVDSHAGCAVVGVARHTWMPFSQMVSIIESSQAKSYTPSSGSSFAQENTGRVSKLMPAFRKRRISSRRVFSSH